MDDIYSTVRDENGIDFDVCGIINSVKVVCDFCNNTQEVGHATSTGGNYRTGEIHTWICQACDDESEVNYLYSR